MSLKKKCLWLFPKFWYICCLLGALYQVTEVTIVYVNYETVTMSNVYDPVDFVHPQVSFCFPIINLMNWSDVINNQPQLIDKLQFSGLSEDEIIKNITSLGYVESRRKLQARFTNSQQCDLINRLTYNAIDMFSECYILENDTYIGQMINCFDIYNASMFFKEDLLCFGFVNNRQYLRSNSLRVLKNNGVIQAFVLNSDKQNQSSVASYFVSYTYPFHGSGFSLGLSFPEFKTFTFTFDIYRNLYLPPPYETNCRRYVNNGFQDQKDCFESCERNVTTKKFNQLIPGPVYNTQDQKLMNLKMRALSSLSQDELDIIESIKDSCDEQCPQVSCDEVIIVPTTQFINDGDNMTAVINKVPPNPIKMSTFIPTLDPATYVIQIGSIIGFWLGLSLFHVYEIIEHVVEKWNQKITAM